MRVTILYFAQLRQNAGCPEEPVETNAANAADLYQEIKHKHGFSLPLKSIRVAVNGDFAASDAPISEGDTVAFMPPMAGG